MQQTGPGAYLTQEVEEAFNLLGVPVREGREVAVDAILTLVSVATTYRENWRSRGLSSVRLVKRSTTTRAGEAISRHRGAGE